MPLLTGMKKKVRSHHSLSRKVEKEMMEEKGDQRVSQASKQYKKRCEEVFDLCGPAGIGASNLSMGAWNRSSHSVKDVCKYRIARDIQGSRPSLQREVCCVYWYSTDV